MSEMMPKALLDPNHSSINDVDDELEEMKDGGAPQEMNDDLGEKETAGAGSTSAAPSQTASASGPADVSLLERVVGFLKAPELKLKKHSSDGLMETVIEKVEAFQSDVQKATNSYAEVGGGILKKAADKVVKSADIYIENKNPWFSKGKRRKAVVQAVRDEAQKVSENAEPLAAAISNQDIANEFLSSFGTTATADSDTMKMYEKYQERKKEQDNSHKDELRAKMRLRFEEIHDERNENRKRSGKDTLNGGARKSTSMGYSLMKAGGYSEEQVMNMLPDFETIESGEKKDINAMRSACKTAEAIFDILMKEDPEKYVITEPDQILDRAGFMRINEIGLLAWEADVMRDRYEQYVDLGILPTKYNMEDMVEISTRITFISNYSNLTRKLIDLFESPYFKEAGSSLMKLFKLSNDEIEQISDHITNKVPMEEFDTSPIIKMKNETVDVIADYKNAIQVFGLEGKTAKQLMDIERKGHRDRMTKLGYFGKKKK